MYTTLEAIIITVCVIFCLGSYIVLKASGTMWYGINWKLVWKKLWTSHK